MAKIIQFNWSRNWKKVEPHLQDPEVLSVLEYGMNLHWPGWKHEDGPHIIGRGGINGQRVVRGKLSWYQPWGRCHWIAPFSWAISKKIFPELKWGFLSGDFHTVAVGLMGSEIRMVSDILLFRKQTAEESIRQVRQNANCKLCFTVQEVFLRYSH